MSGLTFKETIRATLADLMAEDQRVFVIGEDVGVLGGAFGVTAGLLDRFGPERVRDAPISETAILGAAIGAALTGLRPICEMQFVDFMFVALDQLLHQAALAHYASGGANTVPLVIRANYGMGPGAGPQDSGTLYGALLQFPGLTVVIPTSPAEAAALLRQAVRDPNPVLFLEPRELYGATDQVADLSPLPMTKARVLRRGAHLTCAAAGGMVRKALAAADRLAAEDIAIEVIDLRCIMPLDQTTIVASVARTGRILALDEGPRGGGLAAEVLALVAESDVISGRRAIQRLTAAPAPIAYAPHLAAAAVPDGNAVESAMRDMLARDALTRDTVVERQS
jgi:acetoin:2,6-dichlorophenolindophenol oxidoreductase subunit beta